MFNYISPVVAAMLHVAGSLLVVFNSFRLVRQGEELQPHLPVSRPLVEDGSADTAKHSERKTALSHAAVTGL